MTRLPFLLLLLTLLTACENNQYIVNGIDEREANEIVVFLASKNIEAQKVEAPQSDTGNANPIPMFNINVSADRAVEAMAILNKVGLPRRQGTNLLELFSKQGLMSSDREETIRYQAGLAEELKNTIRKIDGVIDADVQISFPPSESNLPPGTPLPKTTAAVYVKHQGVMEDPNSHLEVKIRRLLAGSVSGLDYENVSVISDRSRLADIQLNPQGEKIGGKGVPETYSTIWGMVMTQGSLAKFRTIFFLLLLLLLACAGAAGWLAYRFYPELRKLGKKGETPPPPV